VAVVSVIFATAFIGLLVALGTVVVSETRSAAARIDEYLTEESRVTGQTGVEVDVDRLQRWLDDHGLEGGPDRGAARRPDLEHRRRRRLRVRPGCDLVRPGAAISVILLLFSVVLVIVIRSTCSSTCRGSRG
jgi:hypothetical protein